MSIPFISWISQKLDIVLACTMFERVVIITLFDDKSKQFPTFSCKISCRHFLQHLFHNTPFRPLSISQYQIIQWKIAAICGFHILLKTAVWERPSSFTFVNLYKSFFIFLHFVVLIYRFYHTAYHRQKSVRQTQILLNHCIFYSLV